METLRYVLLANGLLAVVSIAYYVLLRRETFFGANRLALWLGLSASIVLPLLEVPDWRPEPVRAVMQRTARVIVPRVLPNPSPAQSEVTITYPDGQTYPAFPRQQKAVHTPAVWRWLISLYVAGVLFLLIRFGIRLASLVQLIRRSTHEHYTDFILARNESITSPFSFFAWVVLNPEYHEPDELEQILRHERVHVRERHSLDMVGAELLCIVLWFNPAAYLFRYLLHQTLEFSADRAVLAEGVDAKEYQYNLVKVSLSTGRSHLTNHFSKSQLTSRIRMLNRPESAQYTWLKYPVIGIATLTVVATFARPTVQTLKQYIPAPVNVTPIISTVDDSHSLTVQSITNQISLGEKPEALALRQKDSVNNQLPNTSFSSRFTEIRDHTLLWVITPLTTFEDIAQLKLEVAKYGYRFEVDEMKFDMLHKFLVRMDVTVSSSNAHSRRTTDDVRENRPMKSFGGQISLLKPGIQGINDITPDAPYPTKALMMIAQSDEQSAQSILEQNRIDYSIEEGLQLTKSNWITRRYGASLISSQPALLKAETGIFTDSLGRLKVPSNEKVSFWLNNYPSTIVDIQSISLDKIHSIITRDKFANFQKDSGRIILLYTK